jgi:hypothetical protein
MCGVARLTTWWQEHLLLKVLEWLRGTGSHLMKPETVGQTENLHTATLFQQVNYEETAGGKGCSPWQRRNHLVSFLGIYRLISNRHTDWARKKEKKRKNYEEEEEEAVSGRPVGFQISCQILIRSVSGLTKTSSNFIQPLITRGHAEIRCTPRVKV